MTSSPPKRRRKKKPKAAPPSKAKRIELAKAKMPKVLDYFLYVLELHANNSFVVYSPLLASQITYSYAAHAFKVFQRSMYQIEIVRLCAMWDSVDPDKENIPTVVDLLDDDEIIETLAGETHRRHMSGADAPRWANPGNDPIIAAEIERERLASIDPQYADERAALARTELRQTIADARAVLASPQLASIMNSRDKHIAHSLEKTRREEDGPVEPMKYGDETKLLNASIPIIERLYCWVNGTSFSIKNSQDIDQHNAKALWEGCKFVDLR
jgi:AbiU2